MSSSVERTDLCSSIAPGERITALANAVLDDENALENNSAGKRTTSIYNDDYSKMYHIEQSYAESGTRLDLSILAINSTHRYQTTDEKYSITSRYGSSSDIQNSLDYGPRQKTQAEIAAPWLAILSLKQPELAQKLLNDEVDKRFPTNVASYIISASDLSEAEKPATFVDFGITQQPSKLINNFENRQSILKQQELDKLNDNDQEYCTYSPVNKLRVRTAINQPFDNGLRLGEHDDKSLIIINTVLAIMGESHSDTWRGDRA